MDPFPHGYGEDPGHLQKFFIRVLQPGQCAYIDHGYYHQKGGEHCQVAGSYPYQCQDDERGNRDGLNQKHDGIQQFLYQGEEISQASQKDA